MANGTERERLTAEEARAKLKSLLWSRDDSGNRRVAWEKRRRVRFLAGLDAWPPADPVAAALSLLDPDEAPQEGDGETGVCDPAVPREAAAILFSYQAHIDFEAGCRHVLAAVRDATEDPTHDIDTAARILDKAEQAARL